MLFLLFFVSCAWRLSRMSVSAFFRSNHLKSGRKTRTHTHTCSRNLNKWCAICMSRNKQCGKQSIVKCLFSGRVQIERKKKELKHTHTHTNIKSEHCVPYLHNELISLTLHNRIDLRNERLRVGKFDLIYP